MTAKSIQSERSTEGMVDYDRNSSAQQQLVRVHEPLLRELVGRLGQVEPEFRIVDYGCGPGTSAIDAVKPTVAAYRALFPDSPIAVCHADQPGNDWNALFRLATGPGGYRDSNLVRTEAAVGSFFNQMAPSRSVAIGTSFVASHWFSRAVEVDAPGTIWFADLTGDARAEIAAFARSDWVRFLHCRAAELKPGGYMLVATLGSVPDEGEVNGIAASGRGIYRAIQVVAQQMADDGLIRADVLDRFLFGLWFMTAEEAGEPLQSEPDLQDVFDVETIRVEAAPHNASDLFADAVNDPAQYADLYTGYTRAFGASTLRTQLFARCAETEAQVDELEHEFFRRLHALYLRDTAKYACEIWYLLVVLRRK